MDAVFRKRKSDKVRWNVSPLIFIRQIGSRRRCRVTVSQLQYTATLWDHSFVCTDTNAIRKKSHARTHCFNKTNNIDVTIFKLKPSCIEINVAQEFALPIEMLRKWEEWRRITFFSSVRISKNLNYFFGNKCIKLVYNFVTFSFLNGNLSKKKRIIYYFKAVVLLFRFWIFWFE